MSVRVQLLAHGCHSFAFFLSAFTLEDFRTTYTLDISPLESLCSPSYPSKALHQTTEDKISLQALTRYDICVTTREAYIVCSTYRSSYNTRITMLQIRSRRLRMLWQLRRRCQSSEKLSLCINFPIHLAFGTSDGATATDREERLRDELQGPRSIA